MLQRAQSTPQTEYPKLLVDYAPDVLNALVMSTFVHIFDKYMIKFNTGTELRQNPKKNSKNWQNYQKIAKSTKKTCYFALHQWGYL